MKTNTILLSALLLVAVFGLSQAATITVMQDGTGDFVEIQPALDAVASGDTLLIGPGYYTKLIPSYIPGYAYDVDICAYVHVPTLTIIGAGVGQTVLGPEVYPGGGGQPFLPNVWCGLPVVNAISRESPSGIATMGSM